MAAYGALVSLIQVLDDGLLVLPNRRQLDSFFEKVSFLLDFLENFSEKTSNELMEGLENRIRDAACAAEDLIEYRMSDRIPVEPEFNRFYVVLIFELLRKQISVPVKSGIYVLIATVVKNVISLVVGNLMCVAVTFPLQPVTFLAAQMVISALIPTLIPVIAKIMIHAVHNLRYDSLRPNFDFEDLGFRLVMRGFDSIIKQVLEIKNSCNTGEALRHRNVLPAAVSRHDSGGIGRKNVVVGFESDLTEMKTQLTGAPLKLKIVSIIGMGGIGKTTLARQAHDNPNIVEYFDIRAWVAVSQEYSLRRVLLCLLDSAKLLTEEMEEDTDERLAEYLYKSLNGRRYLIVMDDMWDIKIWDAVRRLFPDDYNGSRVLLTTRILDVALYASSCSPHQMQFLDDDKSWKLLREKVFGEKDCPPELEDIGQEIARNCGGLPLAIVVIGGLLYKDTRTQENWRSVAENLNSIVSKDDEQCLEILGLSYNHLPHCLKPCFLYMGAFPEDCEIPVSKLISLWAAEGFLKPSSSKSLEEVAEEYLKDLIERSLVLVCKRSCNGKIKTCNIHDLLRDVCVRNAQKENFLHVVNSDGDVTQEGAKPWRRRLSIHPSALYMLIPVMTR